MLNSIMLLELVIKKNEMFNLQDKWTSQKGMALQRQVCAIKYINKLSEGSLMLYDIIVIGAGPAGLTSGANAANRGLKTLILEGQGIAGGQPATIYPKKKIIDHPGFPKGVTGRVLSKRLYEQAVHSKAEIHLHEPVVGLKLDAKPKTVRTSRKSYRCRRVILATGLHNMPRHHPALDGCKNVYFFLKNPQRFRGKSVIVVGGGDTAFDRANMLSQYARVTVVVKENMAKAKKSSVEEAVKNKVKVLYNTDIVSFDNKAAVLVSGKKFKAHADAVVVSIGFVPSLKILAQAGLRRDKHGNLKVNEHMETSVPGVLAAGDLTGEVKLIAVACSEGILAAVNSFNSIKSPYWLNR